MSKQMKKPSQDRIMTVLQSPIVSEKATNIAEKNNQVAFTVLQDATKAEVKAAVEQLFNVKVESVNMVNIAGKEKRFGKFMGRRNNVRKAYVCLAEGQEISFAEAA
jgi:large subunit ribosomal protein L23